MFEMLFGVMKLSVLIAQLELGRFGFAEFFFFSIQFF